MKVFLFITTILFSSFTFGQDSTKVKAETPRIVNKLMLGKSMQIDAVTIKFVEVIEDSRCPTGVSCVWAGQVKFLVDVYEKGIKTEQKQIILSTKIPLKNRIGNLFSSEELTISGFSIMPYPEYGTKIQSEDYYMQLDVRN